MRGSEPLRKSVFQVFIAAAALFFLTYAVLRAVRVPFTIDEAQTYLRYLTGPFSRVFDFGVANNHFLNTLLARLSGSIFGNGELALRLPNLFGYALYLYFGYRLLERFACRTAVVLGFLLLNLNPYLLDFFSLCRGYGLSLGFSMASSYFFVRVLFSAAAANPRASKEAAWALAAAAGGVFSNFSSLTFYLSIAVLILAAGLIFRPRAGFRLLPGLLASIAIPTLIMAACLSYPLFRLQKAGELYYGGTRGLIADTWKSLVDGSFYGRLYSPDQNLIAGIVFVSVVLVSLGVLLRRRWSRNADTVLPAAAFAALLSLLCAAFIVEHVLFRTPYPMGRTALVFYPLFVVFAVFSLRALGLPGPRPLRAATVAFLSVLTLLAGVHFAGTANAVMAAEWRMDADARRLIEDLPGAKAVLAPEAPSWRLGADWRLMPSLVYYLDRSPKPWLDLKATDVRPENDLYYLHEAFDPTRMVRIKDYPTSGNILVRPRPGIR